MEFKIGHIDEMSSCAESILENCKESRIFIFNGNLGAGKTTLIKEFCLNLGYKGEVTSPTFSLINNYPGPNAEIYHMDLYRLKNVEEALDIGIEEYLISGDYCFIEWPDVILNLFDGIYYEVLITIDLDQTRTIKCQKLIA